jgi:hypothetical protein
MDRFFSEKSKMAQKLEKNNLHLIGLVSLFISSKFEDVIPIHMAQILKDAGHSKFIRDDIILMERNILIALGFKIQETTIYDECFIALRTFTYESHNYNKVI